MFIICPKPPILPPFQAPFTHQDLATVFSQQGISLRDVLGHVYAKPDRPKPLLIGYPVGDRTEGPFTGLQWEALLPPKLPHAVLKRIRTRRDRNQADYAAAWLGDQANKPLCWMITENWAPAATVARGALTPWIRTHPAYVIGAGAVGSEVAESLVRGGAQVLIVCDAERLSYGNMARHTLTADQVGQSKATAVAQRLVRINPFATVQADQGAFGIPQVNKILAATESPLIIECTATEDILDLMGGTTWKSDTWFASVSIAHQARWLYLFLVHGGTFPTQIYRDLLAQFEAAHPAAIDHDELPVEGAGCWHPLFEARRDQVAALVNLAMEEIHAAIAMNRINPILIVIGRKEDQPCSRIDIIRLSPPSP